LQAKQQQQQQQQQVSDHCSQMSFFYKSYHSAVVFRDTHQLFIVWIYYVDLRVVQSYSVDHSAYLHVWIHEWPRGLHLFG
jgi:hypothetical protein